MPSSASVHEQLTDILVQVVGCPADAVVPGATLASLGTDSLTVVEVGEELGRRFGVYLSDDTIDRLVTVDDAIKAVVRHDGSRPPGDAAPVPAALESPAPVKSKAQQRRRRSALAQAAIWTALVGAALGAVFGLGGAALVGATGLGDVDLPPLTTATTASPTPTPTDSPSATPTTPTDEPAKPRSTIKASSKQVSPGQMFRLKGAIPAVGDGVDLQVQVKDEGESWDDFPIQTTTGPSGSFRTDLYTSRTGSRQFRLIDKKSGETSPAVTIQIG